MTYKILSLSGGGVRGIYQAVFLKGIAASFHPKPLYECFNLISGTSTGSIVAAGLAFDRPLEEIVTLFKTKASEIFAKRWLSYLRSGPRYRSNPLREELEKVFGKDTTLKDAKTRILITATVLDRFAPRAFSPFNEPGVANKDDDTRIVDVIMASCAAPTYFSPIRVGERSYVDGGMWANSPSTDAVVHVNHYEKIPLSEIKLLSIGNGEVAQGVNPLEFAKLRPLSKGMITSIFDMMFASQSIASHELVDMMLVKGNFMRIDSSLEGKIPLDDAKAAIGKLPALAEADAEKYLPELKNFLA